MSRSRRKARQAGFTQLELVAVIVIMSVILTIAYRVVMTTDSVTRSTVALSEQDQSLNRAMERLCRELTQARIETLDPSPDQPLGASTLAYERAEIDLDGKIIWSTKRRIEFVASPTDPEDGIDNNGNGLVDECELWLVRDADLVTEYRSLLTRNVASFLEGETENLADDNANGLMDERGLSIELRDGLLLINLSTQARSPSGGVTTLTAETAVRLRN